MIVDLVNISYAEIEARAVKSVEEINTLIVYLQNNGDKDHVWDSDKFVALIEEDIDD